MTLSAETTSDADLVLITLRMAHHSTASGYGRLEHFLDGDRVPLPKGFTFPQRALARAFRFTMRRSGSRWYHRGSLVAELEAAKLWFMGRDRVFHFLYGENSYRYLGVLKALGERNSIVCTYHTPQERFSEVVKDRKHLARLDAVIVMANVQKEIFSPFVGADRVFFVPHGIDVDYFRPLDRRRGDGEFTCLFVGSHLRDMDTLASAARLLEPRRDLRFVVVTKPASHAKFAGMQRVECLAGIDNGALLRLYQQSDLLVLPLVDSTANNALLEAMACGLPAVTTDLAGTKDYVSRDCAVLTPKGDGGALAAAILELRENRPRLLDMAGAARRRAMEFRWENVARKTLEVYECVRRHSGRVE